VREVDALPSVHRANDLETAAREAAGEHVAIHFVVFDQQHFRHRFIDHLVGLS
jgi:hypothetical protein